MRDIIVVSLNFGEGVLVLLHQSSRVLVLAALYASDLAFFFCLKFLRRG